MNESIYAARLTALGFEPAEEEDLVNSDYGDFELTAMGDDGEETPLSIQEVVESLGCISFPFYFISEMMLGDETAISMTVAFDEYGYRWINPDQGIELHREIPEIVSFDARRERAN